VFDHPGQWIHGGHLSFVRATGGCLADMHPVRGVDRCPA
jgi:hypothetical protein